MALYVNGQQVEEEQVKGEMERMREQYEQATAGMEKDAQEAQLCEWARENIVERYLIEQAATKVIEISDDEIEKTFQMMVNEQGGKEAFFNQAGIAADQEDSFKNDLLGRLRVEKLIKQITDGAKEPGDKQIQKHYEHNTEKYTIPEMVRASHIVKHTESGCDEDAAKKAAEQLLAEINETGDFEGVASKNSDCPENAGDLGYFPRGQMVQEFEDVVFGMEVGDVSGVFQTQFGFHVAKLVDKRAEILCPLKDVREAIVKELTQENQQKEIEKFIDAERAKAEIVDK